MPAAPSKHVHGDKFESIEAIYVYPKYPFTLVTKNGSSVYLGVIKCKEDVTRLRGSIKKALDTHKILVSKTP